jgi:hypothetical protein
MYIVHQFFSLLKCLFRINVFHYHKFPLLNAFEGKKAYVLVNGPSLKNALDEYDSGLHNFDENSFMVNLSPLDPRFFIIKPKHFFLSDPIFYQDFEQKKEQVRKMYNLLEEKVNWDLYLYMDFFNEWEYNKLIDYSRITNPNIHFVKLNRWHCSNLAPSLRHILYKRGWFMPEDGTVANVAIYVALIEGYKEIELYGADHSMFLELAVNDNNELCSLDSHFYEEGKPKMHVLKNCCTTEDKPFRVHEFLYIVYVMFNSHNLLRQFADYMGARVFNCTPGSMIDSYERK